MSKYLINESPLVILPTLAKKIGLNEAIVLQQIQYWLANEKVGVWQDGHKWVHNSYAEWATNFPFWSESGVKKIILRLENMGLLISAQTSPNPYDHTKSYRINYENLDETINHVELEEMVLDERRGSENTPDSTPEVRSPHILLPETTNTAANEKTSFLPENLPYDWQIGANVKEIKAYDDKHAQYKDSANLIAQGTGSFRERVYNLAFAFMVTRELLLPFEDAKGNRKAARKMVSLGVEPHHIVDAVRSLTERNFTCVNLFSVEKTAIDLANPTKANDFSQPQYNKFEEA